MDALAHAFPAIAVAIEIAVLQLDTRALQRVRLTGIVSRVEAGRIVEDFAATDTLELVRQLGAWRTLRLLVTQPGLLRSGRAH